MLTTTDDTFAQVNEWLIEYQSVQDTKAKKQLQTLIVMATLPLVQKIACSLARRATDPVDDLIQVGSVGLIKAIDFFDTKANTKFKTYASYLITGEIRHYLRDKVSMIRAPREVQELAFRINSIISDLTKELGRTPTDLEISERLSMPVQKINEIVEIDRRKSTVSLDQTISSNEDECFSLADKIPAGDYQEFMNEYENKIMLSDAIAELPKDLRDLIEFNFYDGLSQREIAVKLGMSQMQVSRKIKRALSEIHNIITKNISDESEK